MSRATTISTGGSIRSSSMPTSNTAADISKRRTRALTMPNSPKKPSSRRQSLLIRRGDRVLDIGLPGWGGLGLYLAEMTGANITRPSRCLPNNCRYRTGPRGREKNLTQSGRSFSWRTIATFSGPFDRIVSVGMFRTCRRRLLRRPISRRCAELLTDDGCHDAAFNRPFRRTRRHQSLDCEIYLPRRLHPPRCQKVMPADRARRAFWCATSKSCGCIMRKP